MLAADYGFGNEPTKPSDRCLLNEIDDPEVKIAAVLRFEPAAVRMPDPLRPASEAATLERLHDLPQPVDLDLCAHPLAVEGRRQFADHTMQRRDVVRQGSEVYGHERRSASLNRRRWPARVGGTMGPGDVAKEG
jgi:hypothetical protein